MKITLTLLLFLTFHNISNASCPGGVCTLAPGSTTAQINTAINTTAACGDRIEFTKGNNYAITSPLTFTRDCSSGSPLIITSDGLSSLPPEGRRVNNTTDVANMAKITNTTGGVTMFTLQGDFIYIEGLELTNNAAQQLNGELVRLEGEHTKLNRNYIHPGVCPNNTPPYRTDLSGYTIGLAAIDPVITDNYIDCQHGISLTANPGDTMVQSTGTIFFATTCDEFVGSNPPTPSGTKKCLVQNNYIDESYAAGFTGGFDFGPFPSGVGYGTIQSGSTQNSIILDTVVGAVVGKAVSIQLPADVTDGNWAGTTSWNSGTTYMTGAKVTGSDGQYYYALSGTTNVNPVGDNNVHWQHAWCMNGFGSHLCWGQGYISAIDTMTKTITIGTTTGGYDGGIWVVPPTSNNGTMQPLGGIASNVTPLTGGKVQWAGYDTFNIVWKQNQTNVDTAWATWQIMNNGGTPKGIIEFKTGDGILIDGNYHSGYPSKYTTNPTTQYGSSAWMHVSNYTLTNNAFFNGNTLCWAIEQEGYVLTGVSDNINCSNNLLVEDSTEQYIGDTFANMGNIQHWTMTHNT